MVGGRRHIFSKMQCGHRGSFQTSAYKFDAKHPCYIMHLRLQRRHTIEQATADGAFSIDIALAQEPIAIEVSISEMWIDLRLHLQLSSDMGVKSVRKRDCGWQVDGPHHFTANTAAPLGETVARRRLLAARGWTVVSVPYWHWDTAPSPSAKQDYLMQVSPSPQPLPLIPNCSSVR